MGLIVCGARRREGKNSPTSAAPRSSPRPSTSRSRTMIAEEDMVVTCSHAGYVKRTPLSLYRQQRRGGKGRLGAVTKEGDFVEHLFSASTHSHIMVFTDRGMGLLAQGLSGAPGRPGVARQGDRQPARAHRQRGQRRGDHAPSTSSTTIGSSYSATEQGLVKKTPLKDFSNPRGHRHHRHQDSGGRPATVCQADRRQAEHLPGDVSGQVDSFSRSAVPRHGPQHEGRKGHPARRGRRGPSALTSSAKAGTILTVTERGLWQAHRCRSVPAAEPRR